MREFIEKLKQHLSKNKDKYFQHHSWMGDTESGFYDEDVFDLGKLLSEIDEFSNTFKSVSMQPTTSEPNEQEEV